MSVCSKFCAGPQRRAAQFPCLQHKGNGHHVFGWRGHRRAHGFRDPEPRSGFLFGCHAAVMPWTWRRSPMPRVWSRSPRVFPRTGLLRSTYTVGYCHGRKVPTGATFPLKLFFELDRKPCRELRAKLKTYKTKKNNTPVTITIEKETSDSTKWFLYPVVFTVVILYHLIVFLSTKCKNEKKLTEVFS